MHASAALTSGGGWRGRASYAGLLPTGLRCRADLDHVMRARVVAAIARGMTSQKVKNVNGWVIGAMRRELAGIGPPPHVPHRGGAPPTPGVPPWRGHTGADGGGGGGAAAPAGGSMRSTRATESKNQGDVRRLPPPVYAAVREAYETKRVELEHFSERIVNELLALPPPRAVQVRDGVPAWARLCAGPGSCSAFCRVCCRCQFMDRDSHEQG